MHHVEEHDEQCKSCTGTGLYVGMAERDGAAVVCHTCEGTGCNRVKVEWDDFDGRVKRDGVKRVYRANPGIVIGEGAGLRLSDFGGLPVAEWESGSAFLPGTEDRKHTCPAWFYQWADCSKEPKWDECGGCGMFSLCKHFDSKSECWNRWDSEFAE